MRKWILIGGTIVAVISCYNISYCPVEKTKDSVVMNTSYIPKNDADYSGNDSYSIYNDSRMLVSTESNGTKVATCVGCHFKCNSCEEK